MPLNTGLVIGQTHVETDVIVTAYYDTTFTPVGASQPLVDGPNGYCLELSNPYGVTAVITLTNANGIQFVIDIPPGDPATAGSNASLTAAQMADRGFTTRGDLNYSGPNAIMT